MYGSSIKIIGTSVNKDHVFKLACDEFYVEPDIEGEEYFNWAFNFCKTHSVDIFFVKKHRVEISKYIDIFKNAGIVVVADKYDIQNLFNSKSGAYMFLSDHSVNIKIPEYLVASSVSEFEYCFKTLRERTGKPICYKLNTDEGGGSFRIVVDNKSEQEALQYPSSSLTLEEAFEEVQSLQDSGIIKPFIIMEYLKGPEVSVDCYNTLSNQGLVCLPRAKVNNRIEKIRHFEEIEKSCKDIQRVINFKYPWNCQFRRDTLTGEYKLLEINTRISGGSHVGIDAGCWIGEYLIKDILGDDYKVQNFKEITIGKIE